MILNMKQLAFNIHDKYEIKPPASANLPSYDDRFLILNNAFTLFLSVISIVSIGFIIWGGIQLVMSEGDKQKVAAARGRITYAVIGLVIAFLSFFMIQLIGYLFDVNTLTIPNSQGQ